MNICVTGGLGFLGSHLIELLLKDPRNKIHVIDTLASSPISPHQLEREIIGFKAIDLTITSVEQYCKNYIQKKSPPHFDLIFHLASVVGPAGVLSHGGWIAHSILSDALAMADVAQICRCPLIDVSTSEIYHGGWDGLCDETMAYKIAAGASPRKEYAAGKIAAEIALLNRSLDVRIVRPFNIAGPRQSPRGGFVLPRFLFQAMKNEPVTVFGNGTQRRAFTDVRDVARALDLVGRRGEWGAVYNVGNASNRCTIQELAEAVITISGSESEITHIDPQTLYGPAYEGAADKFPDASRIKALGWDPIHGKGAIILDTMRYYQSLPSALFDILAGL